VGSIINLAVEDELSEQVMRRVIREAATHLEVGNIYRRGGASYLKQRLNAFSRASRITPYLMLTDLDRWSCPPEMIEDWFGCPVAQYAQKRPPRFLFCIAVREVEAWLLADRDGCAQLLGVSASLLPSQPDQVPDPKHTLVELATRSRHRRVRQGIAALPGSILTVGSEYNEILGGFVRQTWRLDVAASHSPSLYRTMERLKKFSN
jgi:hypothetical protein